MNKAFEKIATGLLEAVLHSRALEIQEWKDRCTAMEEELEAYRSAAKYDAMMEGPAFKGWDRSQLDRARKITESKK